MSLKDDECHPCPVMSSLRVLTKQVRNFFENYINGPDLVSISHLRKTHVPEQGKIYLGKGLSNLRYIVKTPKGDVVEGYLDINVDDELTEKI